MKLFAKFSILALLVTVIALTCGCATRIGPGHVGIIVNNAGSQKGVTDFAPQYGWQFYIPGKTSVFEYPTFVQNVVWTASKDEGNPTDESITFTTKDKMMVNMDVNLAYDLQPDKVPAFYVKFRTDDLGQFTDGFMRSVARDCINDVGGKFGVDDIMGDNAEFIHTSRECLQSTLAPYGVNIEQFGIIGAPRPPKTVLDAINSSAAAKQLAITKVNELQQTQADAAKQVAAAEGDAKATLARAQAQAEANKELAASITDNLIRYEIARKWDGHRPEVEGVGSGLLLNVTK